MSTRFRELRNYTAGHAKMTTMPLREPYEENYVRVRAECCSLLPKEEVLTGEEPASHLCSLLAAGHCRRFFSFFYAYGPVPPVVVE